MSTSFKEIGEAMDSFSRVFAETFNKALNSLSNVLESLVEPSPHVEAKRLATDMAQENYDIVGRNGVTVKREDMVGVATYSDGSSQTEIFRYKLENLE